MFATFITHVPVLRISLSGNFANKPSASTQSEGIADAPMPHAPMPVRRREPKLRCDWDFGTGAACRWVPGDSVSIME